MSDGKLGDLVLSKAKDVDPIWREVGILKNLIKERVHRLDLVRELLANAGSREVGATEIEISYTKDKEGHIYEITDNGCGMNYTGQKGIPGRLDRFLGLGLSGIAGMESDEFSWKGLGSKLAYQSRRVEVETCQGEGKPLYDVRINEPWETINANNIPKPRLSEHESERKGTKIRVVGHPPHRHDQPVSFDELKNFLLHRTFAGYTKQRDVRPSINLSVLGTTGKIQFGFPEFSRIDFGEIERDGLSLDTATKTLYVNVVPKKAKSIQVRVKGFLTWDAERHNLADSRLNNGLILSVMGIPYFKLNMEEYGVTTIRTARPGERRTCLVVECDAIQDEMNISRSALVDSEKTVELKKVVGEIFQRIETSPEYLEFRSIPEKEKVVKQTDVLAEEKRIIELPEQKWVVLAREGEDLRVLMREPEYEQEVNALIWKLEALDALPFLQFRTLAYVGAAKGPDMLVQFTEEEGSEPIRSAVFEVENNFYNYRRHGHSPSQYPKIICWDIPTSGRKVKLNKTSKKYKYTYRVEDFQLNVYAIKFMDGIRVMTTEELGNEGVRF